MPAIVQTPGIINAARQAIEVLLQFKGIQAQFTPKKGTVVAKPGGGHDFTPGAPRDTQIIALSKVGDDEVQDGANGDTPIVKRTYILTGRFDMAIAIDDTWSDNESDYSVESFDQSSNFKTTAAVTGFVRPSGSAVIPAPPAPGATTYTDADDLVHRLTAAALSGHRLVAPLDDGTVNYADAATLAHATRPIWLTTSAWASDTLATLVSEGPVTEPSWSWVPGVPILLGLNGVLTQTLPVGAVFTRTVAEVIDPTTIDFNVQQSIILA